MIFKIDNNLFSQYTPIFIAELLSAMIKHNHYIDCANNRVHKKITNIIENHGGSRVNELLKVYRRFSIDDYHRNLLTEIDANNYTYQQLLILAEKPAVLLPENTYEWRVYAHIINAYTNNPKVNEVARTLKESMDKNLFIARQIGGNGQVKPQVIHLASTDYDGVTMPLKCCVIIDRDVNADYDASGNWKFPGQLDPTFVFLSGKTSAQLTQSDIYVISQPIYHWHMWYKRMIENYFPDHAYLHIGCAQTDLDALAVNRDYQHLSNVRHYNKHDIGRLTEVMGWRDYNANLKSFAHNGVMYTEMELLLLKMCKII